MASLNAMVEDVRSQLSGVIEDQDVFGTLSAAITNTAMTFVVNGPIFPEGSGFGPGVIEIGSELVYVQAVDPFTATATGVLRGWQGTPAVAHVAGELVCANPRYPRSKIIRALNSTLDAVYPDVFAVKRVEIPVLRYRAAYELPVDCEEVLEVSQAEPGSSGAWVPITRFAASMSAAMSQSSTGRALTVDHRFNGGVLGVTYASAPTQLVNEADVFATVTGLPDWTRDMIVLGACARILAGVDAARIASGAASAAVDVGRQYYPGEQISKYFLALYQARKDECRRRLLSVFDVRVTVDVWGR